MPLGVGDLWNIFRRMHVIGNITVAAERTVKSINCNMMIVPCEEGNDLLKNFIEYGAGGKAR
jgi:hypothetical protein